jgi:hypothetical protein
MISNWPLCLADSCLGLDTCLGIGLGGAALTLSAHRLSFIPNDPTSSSSLL